MSKIEFSIQKLGKTKIITAELNHLHSLALNINFWVGSFMEPREKAGISHFLEHIVFKGSQNYPDEQAIGAAVEKYGGTINAFTDFERTNFWITAPKGYSQKILPVLFDVVFRPSAIKNNKEVEKEKRVILEERKMYKDRPDSYVEELADKNLNPKHPISQPIIGYKKTIEAINNTKLIDWWERHYTQANCTIVLVGPKANSLVKEIKRLIVCGERENKTQIPPYQSPQKLRLSVHYKKIKQVNLVWHFERVRSASLKHLFALKILTKILGQGLNSILFAEIRTKSGLSYDISARNSNFKDFQLLSVSGGFAPNKIEKAVQELVRVFKEISTSGINRKHFQEAKKGILGELEMSLDSPHTIAFLALDGLRIFDQPLSINEVIKTIKELSLEDLNALSKELFCQKKSALTLLGPLKEKRFLLELVQKLT